MRNIFDQYNTPENRLTHALINTLFQDRILLRPFILWAVGINAPRDSILELLEQQLPGNSMTSNDKKKNMTQGLPDIFIHDGQRWAFLVENKISAPISKSQLDRHLRTARNRGFEDVTILVLDAKARKGIREFDIKSSDEECLKQIYVKLWSEVYTWFIEQSRKSIWAKYLTDYIEIAEDQLTLEGYLKEGTLTTFSGVPFGKNHPYNYFEAKRILRLATSKLRKSDRLRKELKIDPHDTGRPAITGKSQDSVWDYLALRKRSPGESFTKCPHLTLGIHETHMNVILIIPNGMKSEYRRNLLIGGKSTFEEVFCKVNNNLCKTLKNIKGASPILELLQRHYPSQRSYPIIDAKLAFDLRTGYDINKRKFKRSKEIKHQPAWLSAAYDTWSKKKANIQLAVGARIPYEGTDVFRSEGIIRIIESVWMACKPLLSAMKAI